MLPECKTRPAALQSARTGSFPALSTALLDRHDMMEPRDSADRIEPMLAADAIEPTERNEPAEASDRIEPAEPTDRIEPTEPIDRIDPFDPMLSSESCERIDHREPLPSLMPGILVPRPPTGNAATRATPGDSFEAAH